MFKNARITLTLWYTIVIMIVSALFSVALFHISSRELDRVERMHARRIRRWMELGLPIPDDSSSRRLLPFQDPELIRDMKYRLAFQLIGLNGVILLLSSAGGYLLAGKTLRPIQDMMEEQKQFISDASHELKTPLTALKTTLEVYQRDKKKTIEEANRVIDQSLEQTNRMQRLIQRLLSQSKLDSDDHEAHVRVDLQDVVRASIHDMNPLAKAKGIILENQLCEAFIMGDRERLEELFGILLDNAIKYSPHSAIVRVVMKRSRRSVDVSVIDDGPGIPKTDHKRIFHRFYRGDASRSSESESFGLGLSIAKRIVDLHHARIRVASEEGKGATFTVSFPIAS